MGGIVDAFDLTPTQAGMLFHTLAAPTSGTYVQQVSCRFDGPLDVTAFRAAWAATIARHGVLRGECHVDGLERPAMVIRAAVDAEWRIEDWRDREDAAQVAGFDALLEEDRQRGFRPDQAPLLRFALLRVGADSHRFVWSYHHLLMDGWCGSLLVREVLAHYAGRPAGPPPPPFRRHVEWLAARNEAEDRAWWQANLAGLSGQTPLGIGIEAGEKSAMTASGTGQVAEVRMRLDASLAARLGAMARAARITFGTLVQGAFGLLLARYSGEDDVVFGLAQSGRPPELAGAEEMIGLFLVTVPVRIDAAPHLRLTDYLRAIQSAGPGRQRHGHAGLAAIRRWSGLAGNDPLFSSLLVIENYPLSITQAASDGPLTLADAGSFERTDTPLVVKVFPGTEPEIAVTVDPARISAEDGRRVLAHLRTVLSAMADNPETRLGAIEVTDEDERAGLLALGTGREMPPAAPVHEWILGAAAASPEAVAIEVPGELSDGRETQRLSYGELVARSAAVAAALQARGVGRGDVVGVCLGRRIDLVPVLIGVLRAGAAYVPLDPDYPAERIAHVLEDAGVTLVIAELAPDWSARAQRFSTWPRRGRGTALPSGPSRCRQRIRPISSTPAAAPDGRRACRSATTACPAFSGR
ncbi:condensation domain-containing protein [Methylobrevis pamukkalensis]|uniref:Linear gramicidin synthase subunit B n=1 Tax=Methylobrevis pamukkalensis TaxID=1439726 RepID=A0A1E3H773_9HYPH|nr:condensation domain-containing protein [Methylobrevis pamukkalensis]ODN72183.1 Linear gramicidin synthase subunit B [Methylobrevis pamukkalensis]